MDRAGPGRAENSWKDVFFFFKNKKKMRTRDGKVLTFFYRLRLPKPSRRLFPRVSLLGILSFTPTKTAANGSNLGSPLFLSILIAILIGPSISYFSWSYSYFFFHFFFLSFEEEEVLLCDNKAQCVFILKF